MVRFTTNFRCSDSAWAGTGPHLQTLGVSESGRCQGKYAGEIKAGLKHRIERPRNGQYHLSPRVVGRILLCEFILYTQLVVKTPDTHKRADQPLIFILKFPRN